MEDEDEDNEVREYIEHLEAKNARLREALDGLLKCPAIADGNFSDRAWGCAESAEAERRARAELEDKP